MTETRETWWAGLGVDAASPSVERSLGAVMDTPARGFARTETIESAISGEGALLAVDLGELVGLEASRVGRFLCVSSTTGSTPQVAADGALVHRVDGPDVWIDTETDGRIAVSVEGGSTVALRREAQRADVAVFGPSFEPLAALPIPELEDWLGRVGDAWLVESVRQRASIGLPLAQVEAVGRLVRLRRAANEPAALQLAAERAVAGEGDPVSSGVRAWGRGLASQAVRHVAAAASAKVDRLLLLTERLEAELDPDDEDWRLLLVEVLRSRDDLASAEAVLEDTELQATVRRQVELLDGILRPFAMSIPDLEPLRDLLLDRAAEVDWDAWWAQPDSELP